MESNIRKEIKDSVSKAKSIIEANENLIKDIQKECSHPSTTEMPYYWAPGHYSGQCKVCDDCGHVEHIKLQDFSVNMDLYQDKIIKKDGNGKR